MEKLHKLLFELSSKERMDILTQLHNHSLRLADISRSQNLSPPEASRQLQRMSEALLIRKDDDGKYHLTSYGELVLSQIPTLDFVSSHGEYFNDRDYSGIPYELIGRMREVAKAEYYGETADGLNNIERIIANGRNFIYLTSNKIVTSITPLIAKKVGKHFDLKAILPRAAINSVASDPSIPLGLQLRFLDNVDVLVIASDGISGFGLPDKTGKFDYGGFMGSDPKFKRWCKDLFEYYWDRAREAKI